MSEQTSSLYEQDGVLYLSFHSNKLYLWVCSVSPDDGSTINSSLLQTAKAEDYIGYGRFAILWISQKYIIGVDYSESGDGMQKLIIYDTSLLKLLKINTLFGLYLVKCVSSDNNLSKFIWTNKFDISFSILTIDNQQNMSIKIFKSSNTKFKNNFDINNNILKTNEGYYLSFTLNPIYYNLSLFTEGITFKFDYSMNSLSWESFREVS